MDNADKGIIDLTYNIQLLTTNDNTPENDNMKESSIVATASKNATDNTTAPRNKIAEYNDKCMIQPQTELNSKKSYRKNYYKSNDGIKMIKSDNDMDNNDSSKGKMCYNHDHTKMIESNLKTNDTDQQSVVQTTNKYRNRRNISRIEEYSAHEQQYSANLIVTKQDAIIFQRYINRMMAAFDHFENIPIVTDNAIIFKNNRTIEVMVSVNNYYGIIYTEKGLILCILCRKHISDVESHVETQEHMISDLLMPFDNNFMRQMTKKAWYCMICGVVLSRQVKTHATQNRFHGYLLDLSRKNVNTSQITNCQICDTDVDNSDICAWRVKYDMYGHFKTGIHRSNVRAKHIEEFGDIKIDCVINNAWKPSDTSLLVHCDVCNEYMVQKDYNDHINGMNHRSILKRSKKDDDWMNGNDIPVNNDISGFNVVSNKHLVYTNDVIPKHNTGIEFNKDSSDCNDKSIPNDNIDAKYSRHRSRKRFNYNLTGAIPKTSRQTKSKTNNSKSDNVVKACYDDNSSPLENNPSHSKIDSKNDSCDNSGRKYMVARFDLNSKANSSDHIVSDGREEAYCVVCKIYIPNGSEIIFEHNTSLVHKATMEKYAKIFDIIVYDTHYRCQKCKINFQNIILHVNTYHRKEIGETTARDDRRGAAV